MSIYSKETSRNFFFLLHNKRRKQQFSRKYH